MSGPIVKDISQQYGVTPRRAASVLDIFTSVWQGIIPYGAQILYASAGAAALGLVVTPFDIMPYLLYPYVLGLVTLVFIMIWGAHGQGHEARKAAVDKAAAEAKASAE
jgi:Na+/H+ antiporter NhaC